MLSVTRDTHNKPSQKPAIAWKLVEKQEQDAESLFRRDRPSRMTIGVGMWGPRLAEVVNCAKQAYFGRDGNETYVIQGPARIRERQ